MFEVTDEMTDHVYNWRSKSPSPNFALEHTVRAIIELHEQLKPKPEPFVYYKKQPWGYDECDYGDEGSFPLYDAPPTRERLSEHELNNILFNLSKGSTLFDFARLVEQAHGIGVTNAQPQAVPTR